MINLPFLVFKYIINDWGGFFFFGKIEKTWGKIPILVKDTLTSDSHEVSEKSLHSLDF